MLTQHPNEFQETLDDVNLKHEIEKQKVPKAMQSFIRRGTESASRLKAPTRSERNSFIIDRVFECIFVAISNKSLQNKAIGDWEKKGVKGGL